MVLRYCFGMIMSVSTLIILSGAATPSRVVNLSMTLSATLELFCFMTSAVFVKCRGPQQDGQNEMMGMLKTSLFAVFILSATDPAQADIWCLREPGSSSSGACVFPSAQDCGM